MNRGKGDYQIDYVPAPRITEADKTNDMKYGFFLNWHVYVFLWVKFKPYEQIILTLNFCFVSPGRIVRLSANIYLYIYDLLSVTSFSFCSMFSFFTFHLVVLERRRSSGCQGKIWMFDEHGTTSLLS